MITPRRLSIVTIASLALPCAAQSPRPAAAPPTAAAPGGEATGEPAPLTVAFHGRLPGSVQRDLKGSFRVEFRIYRSPTGGGPLWREVRDVEVVDGAMRIELGTVTPIPFTIHTATYKWVGAAVNGGREVYPRFPIVNVVYASPDEAAAVAAAADTARDTDTAVAPRPSLPDRAEAPATWEKALARARRNGGDLPTYEQWYADLTHASKPAAAQRAGEYEWVLPWVYDSASHGAYNDLFRGRFEGCDYEDLSTQREYRYRIAPPTADDEEAKKKEKKHK